jgi:uncharacterized protein YjiS (DUF1127 family)
MRVTDKVRRWIALIDLWQSRSRGRQRLLAMSDKGAPGYRSQPSRRL